LRTTDQPKVAISVGVSDPPPWVQVRGVFTSRDATTPLPKSVTIGLATTSVDPDGIFEFPAVLPGTYNVQLTPPSDTFARNITVGKSGPALIEVPLILPSVRISGRVTGEDQMKQQGRMKADEFFVPLLSRGQGRPGNSIFAEIPSTWSEPAAAVISEASILRIKPPLSLETRTSLALRFPLANVGETPDERRQTHAQCEARSCTVPSEMKTLLAGFEHCIV
jgi:hypothetical protein